MRWFRFITHHVKLDVKTENVLRVSLSRVCADEVFVLDCSFPVGYNLLTMPGHLEPGEPESQEEAGEDSDVENANHGFAAQIRSQEEEVSRNVEETQKTDAENTRKEEYMWLRHIKLHFKPQRLGKPRAEHQAAYIQRLRKDPEKWAAHREKQLQWMKEWRQRQTEEKKTLEREKNRVRNQERRRAIKEARTVSVKTPKNKQPTRLTRSSAQEQQKQREYWREKQRLRRLNMTPEGKERERLRGRERYSANKKKAITLHTSLPPQHENTPSAASTSTPPPDFVNTSPAKQTKYNSLQKIKKLLPDNPKSLLYVLKRLIKKTTPRKKRKVLEELHKDLKIDNQPRKRQRKDCIAKKKVIEFYMEHSIDLPGKRQYSKRLKKQKKILSQPVSILYNDFLAENSEIKISKRTFFRCRPAHILLMKCSKFVQCMCDICENVRMMLCALSSVGGQFKSVTEALNASLCPTSLGQWWKQTCVFRQCSHCGTGPVKLKFMTDCDITSSVNYQQWEYVSYKHTKKVELVEKSCSVDKLIDHFCQTLTNLSLHVFTSKWQRHQFNSLKKNLPSDTALLVLDFSENYSCKYQFEVQSAHWTLNQVTVHPVVLYTKCSTCGELHTTYHVYLSDDLIHDSSFVHFLLEDVLRKCTQTRFVIFSDNCGAQYKSKLPFHHLSQLSTKYNIERCFFGERHGKNECDSCGGMVKAFLTQAVVSNRVTLRNAKEIFEFLNSSLSLSVSACSHHERHFHLIKPSQIDRTVKSSSLKTLPGTTKIHSLKVLSNEILATRQFSCFCAFCLLGENNKCSNNLKDFVLIKWPNAKKSDDECMTMCTVRQADAVGNDSLQISTSSALDTAFIECEEVNDVVNDEAVLIINAGEPFEVDCGRECETVDDCVDQCDSELGSGNSQSTGVRKTACVGDGVDNVAGESAEKGECRVRRKLFSFSKDDIPVPVDKDAFFNFMYSKMSCCNDFNELKDLCASLVSKCLLFKVNIMDISIPSIRASIDRSAVKLLTFCRPVPGLLPVLTVGDGNCLPRSFSTLVYGTENCHKEIRCRIICELVCNENLYLDNSFVSAGSSEAKNLPLIAYHSDCHFGEDTSDPNAIRNIFEKEVFKTRKLNEHLGLWHSLAAASVLECVVISMYPKKGPSNITALFDRGLVPRSLHYDEPVYIMWTSNRTDMNERHWVANHVVPLVKCYHK